MVVGNVAETSYCVEKPPGAGFKDCFFTPKIKANDPIFTIFSLAASSYMDGFEIPIY